MSRVKAGRMIPSANLRIRWIGWLLAVCIWAGCAEEGLSPSPLSVRDSAGIRIVENASVAEASTLWRLSADPVFQIGWEEDHPAFQDISSGAILSGGRSAVAEADGSRIYYLDIDGSVEREVGRNGEGPGEYQSILAIHALAGDSLLIQDDRNLRCTVLDGDGHYARDFRAVPYGRMVINRAIGTTLAHGILLWPYAYAVSMAESPGWIEGALVRISPDGESIDTVFHAGFVDHQESGSRDPFAGYGAADMGGDVVAYSRNDRAEVIWIDETGKVIQIARWDPERRPVTEQVWEEYAQAYLGRLSPEADRTRAERNLAAEKEGASETLPLFARLVSDQEGNVWLGDYEFPGALPDRYLVFLRSGALIGWVTVPEDLTILDVGEDLILGGRTNEWDVQAVVLYRLEK